MLLRAGYYRMATPVRIQASGVVLRGEGMGDTGTILVGTGTGRTAARAPAVPVVAALVVVAARALWCSSAAHRASRRGTTRRQAVADDYVPVGARSFRVASAAGFRPGDTVVVRRIGNQAWIDAVGMNGDTPA